MYKPYFLLILVPLLLNFNACQPKKNMGQTSNEAVGDTSAAISSASNTKKSLDGLAKYKGKKPKEVKLFEEYNLYPRLEKLLGSEFATFKSDWNEESPIETDGEIFYFTGCKLNACTDNKYFIALDPTTNNINIINFKQKSSHSYEEGSIIGMNDQVAAYFDKIRKEQGLH